MVITLHKPKEKIRAVIVFFSIYIALMLFQTDFMRLGTITASATLILTIIGFFLQGGVLQQRLKFPPAAISLTLFLVYTVCTTAFQGLQVPGFLRYVSQIVLCLILFSVLLEPHEHDYLRKVFVMASTVYSLMIMLSYAENNEIGQSHTRVVLFNTSLDPNFVGIPIVAATVLLLNNILQKEKTVWSAILYSINFVAVMYTASRGSLMGLIVSNFLVFFFFMWKKDVGIIRKISYLVFPVLLLAILLPAIKERFPVEWARLFESDYGDGAGRIPLWTRAMQDWLESPIFGKGLGYANTIHKLETHNTYLQLLSETGLVGVALWLMFLLPQIYKIFRADKALFCVIAGVLMQIAFLDALDDRCLWIILSWITMYPAKSKKALRKAG